MHCSHHDDCRGIPAFSSLSVISIEGCIASGHCANPDSDTAFAKPHFSKHNKKTRLYLREKSQKKYSKAAFKTTNTQTYIIFTYSTRRSSMNE